MSDPLGGLPWAVLEAKSELALAELPDASVDALIMDPPSGIGFMGKAWDADRGGRAPWIDWLAGILREGFRVLKPGGHAAVWALPRTSHWTATAVELAGFDIRDRIHDIAAADRGLAVFYDSLNDAQREGLGRIIDGESSPILYHLFGNGFPKSLNVAKAIEKAAGVKPVEVRPASLGMAANEQWNALEHQHIMPPLSMPEALEWEGWGTALRPAAEHWIIGRKPLGESTVARNVVQHRTGAMNIDGCRVGTDAGWSYPKGKGGTGCFGTHGIGGLDQEHAKTKPIKATKGRHPAHLRLTHAIGCRPAGTTQVRTGTAVRHRGGGDTFGGERTKPAMADLGYAGANGTEEVEAWVCVPACPVGHLGDKARFYPTFYTPKPGKGEKDAGLDHLPEKDWREGTKNSTPRSGQIYEQYGRKGGPRKNSHPTVKPVKLMRWLVRLLCPLGGVVLDPFAGSGTTGVACAEEGMRFLGIEQKAEYAEIAVSRLHHAYGTVLPPVWVLEDDPALDGFV